MIGLVLAGGKSSRLGQDKTRVLHEGQTLLTRTATLLQRHVEQVYISSRQSMDTGGPWPVIMDETERIGPAGGIITALRKLGGPIFVLACDLPFMEDSVIERLKAAREERPPHCVLTTWNSRIRDSSKTWSPSTKPRPCHCWRKEWTKAYSSSAVSSRPSCATP
jgi:molybdenum cofactor guanylyltransferase